MNIMDLKIFYKIFTRHIIENKQSYLKKNYLDQDPSIFKLKTYFATNLNIIIDCFSKLSKNLDSADIIIFLTNINIVIDHNTTDSREMVRNLRNLIKFNKMNNKIIGNYEISLRNKIKEIKVDKIKKLFLNKFN